MKKLRLLIMLCMIILLSTTAYANMAAPKTSDIASTITFEKNQEIAVISEILNITVTGSTADIVASYEMKNTTDYSVSTASMFLSPNIEQGDVQVLCGEDELSYTVKSYKLNYDTQITTDDWQYVILTDEAIAGEDDKIDSITFNIEFDANEQKTIVVSYKYALGGYPDYDFNAKKGTIEYYLTPATMWKDFENLTINLHLDQDMPTIKDSNLPFEKIDTRTYQYVSSELPEENLQITIDENWFQNIFSTLRSPYFKMMLVMLSPFIVGTLLIIAFVVWRFLRSRRIKGYRR
ncbi:MAG: hypothetical protein R3Y09_10755 [Clostridia bacterium]